MRYFTSRWILVVGLLGGGGVALLAPVGQAGEAEGAGQEGKTVQPPPLQPPKDEAAAKAERRERAKRLWKKRGERGEKKERGGKRRGPFPRLRGAGALRGLEAVRPLLRELNVVDRAALAAAVAWFQAGRKEEGQAAAEKVAEKGGEKNKNTGSVARLIIGRMQLEQGQSEKARMTLRTVTGRAAALALVNLTEEARKAGSAKDILAAYKELLAVQPSSVERCRVLKALLDILELPNGLKPGDRANVLTEAAASVPREEALEAQAVLAKEKALIAFGGGAPFGPGMGRGRPPMMGPGGPGGGMGGLREVMQKFREIRELPPGERRKAAMELKVKVEKELKKMEAGGHAEVVKRLREHLERVFKRLKRAPGNPDQAQPLDKERLKDQVRRLEKMGKQDEANELRKKLDQMENAGGKVPDNF